MSDVSKYPNFINVKNMTFLGKDTQQIAVFIFSVEAKKPFGQDKICEMCYDTRKDLIS